MVHEHLSHLRLDLRLVRRRGWITTKELDKELAALPDVQSKARPPEEENAETPDEKGA